MVSPVDERDLTVLEFARVLVNNDQVGVYKGLCKLIELNDGTYIEV
jgi:hypothetical protein